MYYVLDRRSENAETKQIAKSAKYLQGQVMKSIRRMPWHWEPTKDVISCEKLR